MVAPPPRVPGVEYREVYGHLLFDCAAMRASLSPASCSDNFVNRKCLACADCATGRTHSGKTTQSTPDAVHRSGECTRCGKLDVRRLIGGVLCVPCYNREREVLKGRNGKGAFPRHVAATLHQCTALLSGKGLMSVFYQKPTEHPRTAMM